MGVGGGAPVGLDGDGRAEELRDVEKKLARGWVGGEEERRKGLRMEVARRRATAGGGDSTPAALGGGDRTRELPWG